MKKMTQKDSNYFSWLGKQNKGKKKGFVLKTNRKCKPKCPKWDICILQEASKMYYDGLCALANQPKDMSARMLRLLSGDPSKIKENIAELITETDRLTKETKDPEVYMKLIDRYVKYHELVAGDVSKKEKKVSLIDQLRIEQCKKEAIDVEQEESAENISEGETEGEVVEEK